jgi:hypothetical protein
MDRKAANMEVANRKPAGEAKISGDSGEMLKESSRSTAFTFWDATTARFA